MATIKKLYSDNGRLHLLRTALKTAQSDAAKSVYLISDETLQRIAAFLPDWELKLLDVSQYLSVREKEIREKNTALNFLNTVIRDAWDVQKRRVNRLSLPAEVLTYYQLPLNGEVPKSTKEKDLIAIAENMIKGDSEAVAAGYEPITNPSVAELQSALEAARKELGEVAPADRNYDKAEEAVGELRPIADNLISDVVDELRFNLRKREAGSQHRIIKSYGVEIKYNPGEESQNEEEIID